jgi:hypothetical protein
MAQNRGCRLSSAPIPADLPEHESATISPDARSRKESTQIDHLHAQVSITRPQKTDVFGQYTVEFHGDERALRAGHFLTLVPVHDRLKRKHS